jgi:hypothetical protein
VTLRIAAALALLVGATALLLYLNLLGKGPWATLAARHMREMKDRIDSPERVDLVPEAEFDSLPMERPVEEYSAVERRAVAMEGYVQRMMRASDDDIHLELVATARAPEGPDTAYATAEITGRWRRGRAGVDWERLVATFRPNHGGARVWRGGPRRVRVSGWLLYDFQYDEVPSDYSRVHGARIAGWEIHPVTRIERWDDAAGRFVVVAR